MDEHICPRRNEGLATVSPHWQGNPVARGKLVSRQHCFRPGMRSVLKWCLSPSPQRKEEKSMKRNPRVGYLRSLEGVVSNSLVWLGRNSSSLQLIGKRIMFGPVFGDIPFVKRQSGLPADPDTLTGTDYLLTSRDHFDHLDKQSVAWLAKSNSRTKFFCRLGTGELIRSRFPELEVTEAGWYQQIENDRLRIISSPARHWSRRSVRDGGRRLQEAFMVQGDGISIYYSGDTGYSRHLREIPKLSGISDYALVDIGAYKPCWFMQPNHIPPYDVLIVSTGMKAALIIPMHYGALDLPDEPLCDPPQVSTAEVKKRRIDVYIPALGGTVKLERTQAFRKSKRTFRSAKIKASFRRNRTFILAEQDLYSESVVFGFNHLSSYSKKARYHNILFCDFNTQWFSPG